MKQRQTLEQLAGQHMAMPTTLARLIGQARMTQGQARAATAECMCHIEYSAA